MVRHDEGLRAKPFEPEPGNDIEPVDLPEMVEDVGK